MLRTLIGAVQRPSGTSHVPSVTNLPSITRLFSTSASAFQVSATTPLSTAGSASGSPSSATDSSSLVSLLRDQNRFYAVAEIKNRPFLITKNDIIVLDRLKDVELGDIIELNQIKELGSKDYAIKGQPYVSPEYFSIKATVIEHSKGKIVETFKKKRRKHFQRRYHIKPMHTLLRVSELEVKVQ
ncbi:hypothetical protein BGW38_000117 [Lunasporangiospora selenospora]|uniref:Large ribosomal subunit protein bL21m n=1 Tax=Lunasporangiospora selenospora TaxID=979761 RepID=A0A9P6FW64_9FUNG|nr:hypothetical protein BGW38_000117 [Lunasporangiospora selenospora]